MRNGLEKLEEQLNEELRLLEYPPAPWLAEEGSGLDVAIIGGGMAGLAAAFALMREGICNIQILDASPEGYEGPWATYARMLILRSTKTLIGPALDIPKLTFQAWYLAQYGEEAWNSLDKIPTLLWMDYLRWYRRVLKIAVKNECRVVLIEAVEGGIQLHLESGEKVKARKGVLATGRGGFGGWAVPPEVALLPKSSYAHTAEQIDFTALKAKEICILGAGSSGFDAAAAALEAGAASVTILEQREEVPAVNKFASQVFPGFTEGFYRLPERAKIDFIRTGFEAGTPPPFESLDRVRNYAHFKIETGIAIDHFAQGAVHTDRGNYRYDFLIVANGFRFDGQQQPELQAIFPDILLWKDREPSLSAPLGNFPYLGPHFEFLEKVPGAAPYLKHLYCFNYAAILSHGLTSGDIPAISNGALRLAKGITVDFFTQDWPRYFQHFQANQKPEFLTENYFFF